MALEINAQFNKFLRFAEQQANPAKSEAIARMDKESNALDGRAISSSDTDRVRGLFTWKRRSDADKAKNDEIRSLFRKAVADMFGGEMGIPEKVRIAMRLEDYDQGKPLTARRIMSVQKALMPYIIQDAVNGASDSMNRIYRKYNKTFEDVPQVDERVKQQAARIVKRFGSGLNEWGLRVLANAIVYSMATGYDPETEARRVKAMIAPLRDFTPGDPRFAAVDRRLLPYTQAVLDEYMGPGHEKNFDGEGLFDSFIADSNRTEYTINGRRLPKEAKTVQEAFKNSVPNIRHRQALSCFLCQMSMSTLVWMSDRRPMPDVEPNFKGYKVMDQPGAKMFAGLDNSQGQHPTDSCEVAESRVALEISEDGKRATVRLENEGMYLFANDDDIRDYCRPIGSFVWKQDIVFDLSGEDAVIVDTHVGQDLVPNIAPSAKED